MKTLIFVRAASTQRLIINTTSIESPNLEVQLCLPANLARNEDGILRQMLLVELWMIGPPVSSPWQSQAGKAGPTD